MVDIAKCTQVLCPKANECYRIQAKDNKEWQSYHTFTYSVTTNGTICNGFIPNRTTLNKTNDITRIY